MLLFRYVIYSAESSCIVFRCLFVFLERRSSVSTTKLFLLFENKIKRKKIFKVNESRYKQCGVALHFSTGQNLLNKFWEKVSIGIIIWENLFLPFPQGKSSEKIMRKDNYWQSQLRNAF